MKTLKYRGYTIYYYRSENRPHTLLYCYVGSVALGPKTLFVDVRRTLGKLLISTKSYIDRKLKV